MKRRISSKNVGGIFVDLDIYGIYCSVRFPGVTPEVTSKELLAKEYQRDLILLRETINHLEGKIVIEQPVFVWFPEDLDGKCIIVSDMELWLAAKIYEHPTEEKYVINTIPIHIEWQNVYKVTGDEDSIESLIRSYGPIDNLIDLEEIAEKRGYERIDLYNTNAEVEVENVKESNINKDTSADSENSQASNNNAGKVPTQMKKPESILTGANIIEKLALPREVEELVELNDLKNLLPLLNEDDYGLLKQDLLESGQCFQPLTVWKEKNVVIDGHHRRRAVLEIKKENDFDVMCRIRYLSFQNKDEVMLWMLRNQLVARNLSEYDRYRLILKYREAVTEQIKEKRILRNQVKPGPQNASACSLENPILGNSDKKIGRDLNELNIPTHSKNKLSKVRIILQEANEEDKERLSSGKTSINAVYQHIKQEKERKEARKQTDRPPEIFLKAYGETMQLYCGDNSKFILISCADDDEQQNLLEKLGQEGYSEIDRGLHLNASIIAVCRKKKEE